MPSATATAMQISRAAGELFVQNDAAARRKTAERINDAKRFKDAARTEQVKQGSKLGLGRGGVMAAPKSNPFDGKPATGRGVVKRGWKAYTADKRRKEEAKKQRKIVKIANAERCKREKAEKARRAAMEAEAAQGGSGSGGEEENQEEEEAAAMGSGDAGVVGEV